MAPFILDVVGKEIDFLFAFLIGIGFGFILEQAGFSSTRKLAGLFFGYDFTVLRVFFTAAITAMSGLIFLSFIGFINLEFIYINPLYLRPAIIGGAVMGAGFILGGFCPGTSVCAASIGKIDAIVFIIGLFLGIIIFVEGFPLFESLYKADNMGAPLVFTSLGISKGFFAFILIFLAIAAFIATSLVENKVNKKEFSFSLWINRRTVLTSAIPILIGFILIFMPDQKSRALSSFEDENWINSVEKLNSIDSDKLAINIIQRNPKLRIIDVRPSEDFRLAHIPSSVNIPFENLTDFEWRELLNATDYDIVILGTNTEEGQKATILVEALGYTSSYFVLEGGFPEFRNTYFANSSLTKDATVSEFRKNTAKILKQMLQNENTPSVPREKRVKVSGGC